MSSEMSRFGRAHMISYYHSIVTMPLLLPHLARNWSIFLQNLYTRNASNATVVGIYKVV